MYQNISKDFRIVFRRLIKERKYSFLNIIGLSIGMAAAMAIFLYLRFENSYDKYHPDHENIYRIGTEMIISGEKSSVALNSLPMAPLLVDQMPEFTSFLRIFAVNHFFRNMIYEYEDKQFYEGGVFAADSSFFDFFHFDFIYGEKENALTEPFSFVMTQSMAVRYFGDINPVGKIISLKGAGNFKVTAVVNDAPLNSHMLFSGLLSMSTMPRLNHLLSANLMHGVTWEIMSQSFGSRFIWAYVKTTDNFNPEEFLDTKWYDFYESHIGNLDFFDDIQLIFQPIADIHLKSKLAYEMTSSTGSVTMMSPITMVIFFTIAIFLLVLASINYANISISRFNQRSKEIGVKKVLGATSGNLIRQFFTESILFASISFVLALLMVELATPFINDLMGVALARNYFGQPEILFIFLGVMLFVGVLSGMYPAFYFSSFSPLKVLQHRMRGEQLIIKKALIILQFTVSVFMITATIIVVQQLKFINNKDLGFRSNNIVVIELRDDTSRQKAEVLQNELLKIPEVSSTIVSNFLPSIVNIFNSMDVENEQGVSMHSAHVVQVPDDFSDFMGVEMSEGRFFDSQNQSDYTDAIIINEAAKKEFGMVNPIGKTISNEYQFPDGTTSTNRKVIGVVKDFHYTSLHKPIEPMVFYPMSKTGNYLMVRISEQYRQASMAKIEQTWNTFQDDYPIDAYYLQDVIKSMYSSQRILSIFFGIFAAICIIIAFIGIYGLSAYSVEQRTREIGIRKVLGGNLWNIFLIIGKEFLVLLIISSVLATALSFYFMADWLSGFAYHTNLGIFPFLTGIFVAFFTAFLAVFIQARIASSADPVQSLKYE
ncbi:MAG: ABC transporter permease [Bacteroidota bacterium]